VVNQAGERMRRAYSFIVTTVRFTGEQPCEAAGNILSGAGVPLRGPIPKAAGPAVEERSILARLQAMAKKLFGR
jgi:hypothetical protein